LFIVEKLARHHPLDDFDCGNAPLNAFLQRHALQNQQANASQTYVGLNDGRVIGYHTLAISSVHPATAPERVARGLARHSIPVMLLARLAVANRWQGKGVGSSLLKDALMRALAAAQIAGVRAFTVNAKDETARAFYSHFDFIPSPSDPMHLFLLLKDARAQLL
jgi:GNAT superfamily N-acetyltransferase